MVIAAIVVVALLLYIPSCMQKRRSEAAQARVDNAQAQAAQESAKDAIGTVARSGEAAAASEDLTRSNERDIRAAEGANEQVKAPVGTAGRRALCQRNAYRDDPKCKVFRQ